MQLFESSDPPAKRCPACGDTKPLIEFPRNKRSSDGYAFYCKPCHNRKGRESRERHHGSARSYHLKARYGITAAEADRMREEQGGLCAICRERPADHVDHDHVTGQTRRLLCFNCNGGLGQFHDDTELLRAAISYLEEHQPRHPRSRR
ncbi:MAG: hypothetical protein V7636_46 [Actinomycetota bacterium]